MKDQKKTKEQLISELEELRREKRGHKRAEEALRESEEKFRSLAENSQDCILRYDEHCRHLYQNTAGYRISGFSEEEFIGRTHRELGFDEDLCTLWEENIIGVFKSGQPTSVVFEWESVQGPVYLDLRLYPEFDQDEKVKTVMGISHDITERKRAEEALRESEKRYRLLFNSGNDAVFVHPLSPEDRPGNFIEVNDIACQRLGYTREELLKLSLLDIDTPGNLDDVPPTIEELFAKKHVRIERVHVAKDGRGIPVEIIAHLFDLHGQPAVLSSARDITERKRTEKKLQQQSHVLGERIKELNCLYEISRLVETPDITIDKIIQGTVDIVPVSWQYPEITCARIILDDQKFETELFRETSWKQSSKIKIFNKQSGILEVFYMEEMPGIDEGPFLKEERSLIDAIAERLGRITERKRAEKALRESEMRLKEAQRVGATGDWEFDVETQEVFWSEEVYRLFERDPAQGPPTFEQNMAYYYPEDSKRMQEQVRRAVELGEAFDSDYHLKLPSARSVYHRGLIRVAKGRDGRVTKLYGTVQDITERKKAEEALRGERTTLSPCNRSSGSCSILQRFC